MSTQEIIRELAKLDRNELAQVDLKLHELLEEKLSTAGRSWGEALLEVAGTVEGLPPDYAENHDRYLHWAAPSMKVFGDTVHFIAYWSTGDRWHVRAVAISRQPPCPLVTTEWVLTEVGDAFSHLAARQKFIRLLDLLREQPDVDIVPSTSDLFQRGTAFFSARPDKEWSLTDCISFVVMNERGITDALTSDHHFEQAGFRILLKD